MHKDYLIHMSFPKNYSTKDTLTYPVLYVLDGKALINISIHLILILKKLKRSFS